MPVKNKRDGKSKGTTSKINVREKEITLDSSTKKVLGRYIEASENKKKIGHILYDVDPKRQDNIYTIFPVKKTDGGISHLWIKPKYRNMGIGTKMIRKVERQAKKDRKKRLVLEAFETNRKAIKFYKKHGFEKIGKKTFSLNGKKTPMIMMVKELK